MKKIISRHRQLFSLKGDLSRFVFQNHGPSNEPLTEGALIEKQKTSVKSEADLKDAREKYEKVSKTIEGKKDVEIKELNSDKHFEKVVKENLETAKKLVPENKEFENLDQLSGHTYGRAMEAFKAKLGLKSSASFSDVEEVLSEKSIKKAEALAETRIKNEVKISKAKFKRQVDTQYDVIVVPSEDALNKANLSYQEYKKDFETLEASLQKQAEKTVSGKNKTIVNQKKNALAKESTDFKIANANFVQAGRGLERAEGNLKTATKSFESAKKNINQKRDTEIAELNSDKHFETVVKENLETAKKLVPENKEFENLDQLSGHAYGKAMEAFKAKLGLRSSASFSDVEEVLSEKSIKKSEALAETQIKNEVKQANTRYNERLAIAAKRLDLPKAAVQKMERQNIAKENKKIREEKERDFAQSELAAAEDLLETGFFEIAEAAKKDSQIAQQKDSFRKEYEKPVVVPEKEVAAPKKAVSAEELKEARQKNIDRAYNVPGAKFLQGLTKAERAEMNITEEDLTKKIESPKGKDFDVLLAIVKYQEFINKNGGKLGVDGLMGKKVGTSLETHREGVLLAAKESRLEESSLKPLAMKKASRVATSIDNPPSLH